VDLATAEEADAALNALSGVSAVWGSKVQINKARGNSRKLSERERWEGGEPLQENKSSDPAPPLRSRWGPPSGFEDEAPESSADTLP